MLRPESRVVLDNTLPKHLLLCFGFGGYPFRIICSQVGKSQATPAIWLFYS